MFPKPDLRVAALAALLMASAVQGLTPATFSIASPWAFQRLSACAAADQPDARHFGLSEKEHPSPPDSDDREDTSGEMIVAGDLLTQTLSGRRTDDSDSLDYLGREGSNQHADPSSSLAACPHHPARPLVDQQRPPCRMTC
jgi:hypothetical protein